MGSSSATVCSYARGEGYHLAWGGSGAAYYISVCVVDSMYASTTTSHSNQFTPPPCGCQDTQGQLAAAEVMVQRTKRRAESAEDEVMAGKSAAGETARVVAEAEVALREELLQVTSPRCRGRSTRTAIEVGIVSMGTHSNEQK